MSTRDATDRFDAAAAGATSDKHARVLIVEDNACDVEMILDALKQHGVPSGIAVTRDGQEALDFLFGNGASPGRHASRLPRLVLLDLKMPRVGGHEVLRRIRSEACTKTIPVVVFTASLEERDIAEAYELGANSYIVKPYDFDKFSEALAAVSSYWLTLNQPSH